ncbi:MAG: EamA/RhaT family transporter, partial [Burkholderiales bacterium]
PATLVRFVYGLPFAFLWLWLVYALTAGPLLLPTFTVSFWFWLVIGAFGQIAATFFLLSGMQERNFIVAVTYSKTELVQIAVFGLLFLADVPSALSVSAVVVASFGVVLLSMPKGFAAAEGAAWTSRAALLGLASGTGFAFANIGYRGAALALGEFPAWLTGAWGVLLAQIIQSVALGLWLEIRTPGTLAQVARAWRLSSLAGACGALASIGWFTAFALRPATDVRILGLTEVFFSYLVSRRLFRESMTAFEIGGMLLVSAAVVLVCL